MLLQVCTSARSYRVAGCMTPLIVDRLEVVDVQHQHRELLSVARLPVEFGRGARVRLPPVCGTGERVKSGKPLQVVFQPLALRHVTRHHNEAAHFTGFVRQCGDDGASPQA
jgi:hypothetical protein